jgi:hypothetical protein
MTSDAAKKLVDSLTASLTLAIDCKNKLTAFELALQKYEPNVYASYTKMLEGVRQNQQSLLPLSALAELQQALLRD